MSYIQNDHIQNDEIRKYIVIKIPKLCLPKKSVWNMIYPTILTNENKKKLKLLVKRALYYNFGFHFLYFILAECMFFESHTLSFRIL